MQTSVVKNLARHPALAPRAVALAAVAAPRIAAVAAAQLRRSSFIKQVMEQVKRDMEADEKTKKDWEKVQQSGDRLRQTGVKQEERLRGFAESAKSVSSKTSELLGRIKERADSTVNAASSKFSEATEQSEALRKAAEALRASAQTGAAGSRAVLSRTRDVFSGVMDSTSKAFSYMGEEQQKADKHKEWKAARDAASAQAEGREPGAAAADGEAGPEPAAAATDAGALVVSKPHTSSWDRLGAGLRDMPFLSSVFENPLFDRLFGESEIAASIREMKQIDYRFRLEDFAEDMEYIIAPHIIKNFLEGDQKALEKHCGEAAFLAVNASIKERKRTKLSVDTAILAGPKEIELKGAKLMEKGPPCFIWTFNMQQVNCLRNSEGEIIEGAVDDIRTVCYAMAVTRHPNVEQVEAGLEYPWQVSELAILWNQPCF